MNELFPEKKLLHVVCFMACLLCAQTTCAQDDYVFQFEHITAAQGLFSNSVSQIVQDKKGFIWITTTYGLERYDGNSFKHFYYNPNDSNTILPGLYSGIREDKKGILWIASVNHGLYSFNSLTK
jgi:ligand-binding sensor domain-containing protein